MFDHIIVADNLLPIREAAGKGDVNAMFRLLEHVIHGDSTGQNGHHAMEIVGRMVNRKEFHKNPRRVWNSYMLQIHALRILYEQGEMDEEEYLAEGCDWMEIIVEHMARTPRQLWDHNQMIKAIQWIRDNEPEHTEQHA